MKPTVERLVKWEPAPSLPRALSPNFIAKESGKNGGFSITLAEPSAGGRTFRIHFNRAPSVQGDIAVKAQRRSMAWPLARLRAEGLVRTEETAISPSLLVSLACRTRPFCLP
jgi:hypothetical protein